MPSTRLKEHPVSASAESFTSLVFRGRTDKKRTTNMSKWTQPEMFPGTNGFQWHVTITAAPGRDDLIVERRILGLPKFEQLAHALEYKNRTAPGVMSSLVDTWDSIRDLVPPNIVNLPVWEEYDAGPPF